MITYKIDALDCLLLYGYKIVREPGQKNLFRLCNAKAYIQTRKDKAVVAIWLKELEESKPYYAKRICDLGGQLPCG